MSAQETAKRLFEVRKKIEQINEMYLKELKDEKAELEQQLLAELAEGESRSFDGIGSVSHKTEIVPHVEDWEAVHEYIYQERALYMLPHRLLAAKFREALEIGLEIPGTKPVTLSKLSVRKA